jgi:hypothetical protein
MPTCWLVRFYNLKDSESILVGLFSETMGKLLNLSLMAYGEPVSLRNLVKVLIIMSEIYSKIL